MSPEPGAGVAVGGDVGFAPDGSVGRGGGGSVGVGGTVVAFGS